MILNRHIITNNELGIILIIIQDDWMVYDEYILKTDQLTTKSPLPYGFPMVFLWFPMVFPWLWPGTSNKPCWFTKAHRPSRHRAPGLQLHRDLLRAVWKPAVKISLCTALRP